MKNKPLSREPAKFGRKYYKLMRRRGLEHHQALKVTKRRIKAITSKVNNFAKLNGKLSSLRNRRISSYGFKFNVFNGEFKHGRR